MTILLFVETPKSKIGSPAVRKFSQIRSQLKFLICAFLTAASAAERFLIGALSAAMKKCSSQRSPWHAIAFMATAAVSLVTPRRDGWLNLTPILASLTMQAFGVSHIPPGTGGTGHRKHPDILLLAHSGRTL